MKPPKHPSLASPNTQDWWGSPGVVYFVAAGSPPIAIKIGMAAQTKNHTLKSALHRRLSQIQSSNHELIELIGVVYFTDGDYPSRDAEVLERELHIEFEHLQRFKKHLRGAEWFTASAELLVKINEISTKPIKFDLPVHFTETREGNA